MRHKSLSALAGLTLLSMAPSQAQAADILFNRYLAGGTCYMRLYDAQHMRRNPKQTLSKFHVVAMAGDPLKAQHPKTYTVRFNYWIKNAGYYDGQATCNTLGAGATCSVEADGGSFVLTPQGKQLKVTLGSRLEVEGAKNFSPNVATSANRVMLLPAAPSGSCRSG